MKLLKNIVFSVLVCILAILFLEGSYRLLRYFKHGHVKYLFFDTAGGFCNHDVYGNAFTPGFDSTKLPDNYRLGEEGKGYGLDKVVKINRRGYRTHEFTEKKDEKTYRIITIGGSTTFCYGDNDKTWPAYLEQALNKKVRSGYRFEVLNLGVGGYRSIEELLVFKNEAVFLHPDMITLYTGWNDLAGSRNKKTMNKPVHMYGLCECKNQIKNIKTTVLTARNPSFFEKHFLLYQQLDNRFLQVYVNNRYDAWEQGVPKDYDYPADWVVAWKKNIDEIIDTTREKGIGLVMIDYPCLARKNSDDIEKNSAAHQTRVNTKRIYDFWVKAKDFLSYQLHQISKARNVPLLESACYFENFTGPDRAGLFTDEMHLREKGNLLLGEYLAEELGKLNNDKKLMFFLGKSDKEN